MYQSFNADRHCMHKKEQRGARKNFTCQKPEIPLFMARFAKAAETLAHNIN